MQPAWGVAILMFMDIDLSSSTPCARTREEAQELIDELWLMLRAGATDRGLDCEPADLGRGRLHTDYRNSSTSPSTDPHRLLAKKPPSGKKPGA